MYISMALCQLGRSQIIVLVSYVYIPDPVSVGKVPEYSTGSYVSILCPMFKEPRASCNVSVLLDRAHFISIRIIQCRLNKKTALNEHYKTSNKMIFAINLS